jgi:fatty acid desaturase
VLPARTTSATDSRLPGSPDLRVIAHPTLGTWLNFRESLTPRFWLAWREIAICLSMIVGGFLVHLSLTYRHGNVLGFELAVPFAVWIGFWLQGLLCFGHEAAHYNLSESRARNDALSDWTVFLFFPQTTKIYRKSHWQHHLHLGDLQDTEISYHNCLSPWFLAKAVTGIYLVALVARYFLGGAKKASLPASQRHAETGAKPSLLPALMRVIAVQSIFLGACLLLHCYATAAAWLVGNVLIFPFLTTVRQVLEHRAFAASCQADFTREPHGPVNRIFGGDLFSRFYGAAGFNRHMLHHWDPTVSYTRFDDMEAFFEGTEIRAQLRSAQSSYSSSLLLLVSQSLHDHR